MADRHAQSEEVVFRSSKRRKIFRKRPDEEHDNQTETKQHEVPEQSPALPAVSQEYNDTDEDRQGEEVSSASNTAPFRRHHANRKAGVGFSNSRTQRTVQSQEPDERREIARQDPGETASTAGMSRFTAPSGQVVVKDDKHM